MPDSTEPDPITTTYRVVGEDPRHQPFFDQKGQTFFAPGGLWRLAAMVASFFFVSLAVRFSSWFMAAIGYNAAIARLVHRLFGH